MVLGEEYRRGKVSFLFDLLMLTLITWLRWCLSGFFTVNSFPCFPYYTFRKKSLCTVRVYATVLEIRVSTLTIWSSFAWEIELFSSIYLFTQFIFSLRFWTFELIETCLLAQHVIYIDEHSICTWKESMFCSHWV